ncbi:MAG: flavin reductase family protein, partial [Bacteroidetes bacterium]|nr:flavin reductase family protein [Bacteroidota bacterium]
MDENAKKYALRMIPYGLYILTAESENDIVASTINWVTQTSFQPPMIAIGVKVDSNSYKLIQEVRKFALNMLGKGQADLAYAFFKPAVKEDGKIS